MKRLRLEWESRDSLFRPGRRRSSTASTGGSELDCLGTVGPRSCKWRCLYSDGESARNRLNIFAIQSPLVVPTRRAIVSTGRSVSSSIRHAHSTRSRERNSDGETPISSLKWRNRLRSLIAATAAMSVTEIGRAKFCPIHRTAFRTFTRGILPSTSASMGKSARCEVVRNCSAMCWTNPWSATRPIMRSAAVSPSYAENALVFFCRRACDCGMKVAPFPSGAPR